jgi:hypothetical protein
MDKITKSLLDSFANEHELEGASESIQFEHFAIYSVVSKLNRNSFDLMDIHTGSGGDCAIDGISISVNGQIISSADELHDIVGSSGFLDCDITFIQAKTSSNFDGSSIGTFIHGIKDFLSDEPKLVQNEKIKDYKVLWEEIIGASSLMVNRRPICRIYYVCTGKWVDDQNLVAVIGSGKNEIDGIGLFENVIVQPVGASELQRLFHETKNKLSATINFQNRITLPDIAGVQESYLGVVPFFEYLKLIQDENHTIHSIFDDNVRDFQGNNPVNKKIKNTLESKQFDLFCVLNNGVTIVSSSLTPAGNRFTLRDYQVVNGCQTSHVLHESQGIEGIEEVFVPVKIIITENDDVKTSITMATNSQTEVRPEQLEALSIFQKKLELYYQAVKSPLPLFYERRSQQYNGTLGIKKTQVITIPIQIKAFASVYLNSPHLVSGYYGTIVKRFRGQIFGADHKFSPYYASALSFYRLEQLFRSGDIDSVFKKARFQLMMLARILESGPDLDPFNSNIIEKRSDAFVETLLDDSKALHLFERSLRVFTNSGIDLTKRQYKSESETELLINAAKNT